MMVKLRFLATLPVLSEGNVSIGYGTDGDAVDLSPNSPEQQKHCGLDRVRAGIGDENKSDQVTRLSELH